MGNRLNLPIDPTAQVRLRQAQQELAIHTETLRQNQEQADFLRSKFSTQQLYAWMCARLSGLYYQVILDLVNIAVMSLGLTGTRN